MVADEKAVLVCSFVGYTSQEITVGTQPALNVRLLQDAKQPDDVVVVGYGTRVKANAQAYYCPAGAAPVPSAFTNGSLTFPLPVAEAQLSPYF